MCVYEGGGGGGGRGGAVGGLNQNQKENRFMGK